MLWYVLLILYEFLHNSYERRILVIFKYLHDSHTNRLYDHNCKPQNVKFECHFTDILQERNVIERVPRSKESSQLQEIEGYSWSHDQVTLDIGLRCNRGRISRAT